MRPLIYAHRGASADAPENTLSAFKLAIEQGSEGIELDVQMTADGKLVVIHDETLDRTTTGSGFVSKHTYDEIRRLDSSYHFEQYKGEQVPLLADVLSLLETTKLEINIELKNGIIPYDGMEEAVINMVREYDIRDRVTLSSFNHYSIVKMVKLAPDIECGALYVAGLYQPWKYAKELGVQALHPYFYSVVPEIVEGAKKAGLKVRPYTVNDVMDLQRMIDIGVDAIITNYPLRLRSLLKD